MPLLHPGDTFPQLRGFGVGPGEAGLREDWHGGSRASANKTANTLRGEQ